LQSAWEGFSRGLKAPQRLVCARNTWVADDRSEVADAPDRSLLRRNGKHDDAERKHRQTHEFKHQSVHGNSSASY
jgi:hypothetical protein